ncbi:MAG TPA: efflux RND transporter periplasmic adaptor subunit [Candidatus Binatia bacterium]|nr:efflux RND transporter periplasmic adaptor subunit [Candidatus Binatia bacterium]
MRLRRSQALAIGAVALLGAIAFARYGPGRRGAASGGYVTVAVDRGPVEATVTATGTVNPVKTVQVGTYVSGPIKAIYVDFNSPVTQGELVAKIDPAPFAVKVEEAEANVANARAQVAKDRADLALKKLLFERNAVLLRRRLIAQNDLDTARSNHDQAAAQLALDQASLQQQQAALEEARVNLAYTDIRSPVDGVVVSRNVDVGQTVAASFQTPTLFLIAEDLTKMQVDTNVSESDVGRVAEGQAASFTVDAYPAKPFRGTVAQVRNAPITVQNVVTYDVVIAVANPDLELKPGMTATVSITTARRDAVLRIPLRALRFRPEEAAGGAAHASPVVWVAAPDGALRRVEVRTGIRDERWAEVVGGALQEGDRVVTGLPRRAEAEAEASSGPPRFPHHF